MNRLSLYSTQWVSPEMLPPATAGERVRVLFVNVLVLGWGIEAKLLRQYTATRDDIDAVHLNLSRPFWFKLLGKRLFVSGLDYHAWRYIQLADAWIGNLLRRSVNLDHFDMVHVMPHWYAKPFCSLKRTRPQLRTAVRLDQTGFLEISEFQRNAFTTRRAIRSEQAIFASCDLISSWSQWAADSLVHDYAQPAAKIIVAPPSLHPTTPSDSASSRAVPAQPCRMIFIGNDWKRKGGARLLNEHQARWADSVELHVVSSSATPDYKARNVIWHGVVPHERLTHELLPKMDFLVLMTQEDCLPLVLVEAAVAGVPAVTVRLAGIPEVVNDSTGILVPPEDWSRFCEAVERMIQNADLRQRLGEAARKHARQRFDPGVNYGRLLNAFSSVCSRELKRESSHSHF